MTDRPATDSGTQHETLILGAGPAGLQLGHFLERAGRDYLILEAGERPGAFFEHHPRHRLLISINKVYTGYDDPEINLRWDWNSLLSDDPSLLFKEYSKDYFPGADVLLRYLADYTERLGIRVRYRTRAQKVARDADGFVVTDADGGIHRSRRLVVATGFGRSYIPPIPGIEHTENYWDMPVDPQDYVNQKVLILGKGNSAFETADALTETTALIHVISPKPITLAWKSHHVGHLRAINNNFLDTYQLKAQNAVLDGEVRGIEKTPEGKFRADIAYSHAEEESEELLYDRVLCCTGFAMDPSIFDDSCRPALCIDDRFPAQTAEWESVNIPDLFYAGVLMHARDFKRTTSGFIHGFRYNVRALHRVFEQRYHAEPWPRAEVAADPEGLADAFLERINQTSALWQQFGFLGDLYTIEDGERAHRREEIPLDLLGEQYLPELREAYVVTLEFGKVVGDPFNIQRSPDPERAEESVFLHPVIRHYRHGELLAELHLLENLLGEWKSERLHRQPLLDFLHREVRRARAAA